MSLNRYFFLFIFMILATPLVYAQEGYIIIDSLYSTGVITEQNQWLSHQQVIFSKSPRSPKTTYYPTTVKEYGFARQTFVSRKISTGSDSTIYFLEVLTKGKVQLYMLNLNGQKRFFIETSAGMTELIKTNDAYQKTISSQLTDCEISNNYVSSVNYTNKALRRFTTLYNSCYKKGPWPMVRVGVTAGVSSTTMKVIDSFGKSITFENEVSPYGGLVLDLPIGLNPKWILNMQALFQQNSYEKHIERRIAPGLFHPIDYSLKTSTVSLPIVAKYCIPAKNMKYFVSAGISTDFHFKTESEMVEEITPTQMLVDDYDLVKSFQATGVIGLGIEYFLKAKTGFGLEVRYNKGGSVDAQKVKSTQVLLSYYF